RGQASDPPNRDVSRPSSIDLEPSSARRYTPLPTLAPRSWRPILEGSRDELRLGAETGGADVLGYHGYAFSATWLTTTPSAVAVPTSARPEWHMSYQYSRWRPTLWFTASMETSFFAGPANEVGGPSLTTTRERLFEGGFLFPVQHIRTS